MKLTAKRGFEGNQNEAGKLFLVPTKKEEDKVKKGMKDIHKKI